MGKSILLADDSVTIQKVVELTFMEEDVEVTAVGSGDGAIQKLEEGLPDLVIADVHMPGADGYEVCRFVKERSPATPVLLLVGTFEPFDPDDVGSCGGDGHLKKPFDSQELIRRVDELMGGAAGQPAAGDEAEAAPAAVDASDTAPAETAASGADEVFADARTVIAPLPDLEEIRARGEAEAAATASAEVTSGKEGAETATDAPTDEPPPPEPQPAAPDPEPATPDPEPATPEPEAASVAEPAAVAPAPESAAPAAPAASLSDADIDRIARRLVELVGEKIVREVAWEVVPDLAEVVIKDRLRELEGQTE